MAFSILLLLLLASTLTLAFNVEIVKASETIFIRANGLVEGTDKIVSVDNVTYTLTGNIYDTIQIERNNTVLDGASYLVQATEEVQVGIELYFVNNVTLKNAHINGFWVGIHLSSSSNNRISGNNITNNWGNGIEVSYSSNNTITENNIVENGNGITIYGGATTMCENNTLYHNNIMNNTNQVYNYAQPPNFWDDGYPSGGNYWSDYKGIDVNHDGIGDGPYAAGGEEQDEYPLMGPISFFDAGTWDNKTFYVHTVSNSSVSDFYFSESKKLVGFNVTGLNDTVGFCRVAIPNDLLWCDNPEKWQIWINDTLVEDRNVLEDASYACIYFTFNQSIQNVEIRGVQAIPEGFSFGVVASLSLVVITVSFYCLRKRPKTTTLLS